MNESKWAGSDPLGETRGRPPAELSIALSLASPDAKQRLACASLRVTDDQRKFVAPVASYLNLCDDPANPWEPLVVLDHAEAVGFVMTAVDASDNSLWIGGLVINEDKQGRGYGRLTVSTIVGEAISTACSSVALSYDLENVRAQSLYASLGFIETGDHEDNEVVARLSLLSADLT